MFDIAARKADKLTGLNNLLRLSSVECDGGRGKSRPVSIEKCEGKIQLDFGLCVFFLLRKNETGGLIS